MKRHLILIGAFWFILISSILPTLALSGNTNTWIDLSKMTPRELREFYKWHPEYLKTNINLSDYQQWDWLIIAWNTTQSGTLFSAKLTWNTNEYMSVSNDEWKFRLEIPKKVINNTEQIRATITYDNFSISSKPLSWDDWKKQSLYQFDITPENTLTGTDSQIFKIEKKQKKILSPSYIGIQWIWFLILILIISIIWLISYFRTKRQ